jgi:hypothetical protein
MTRCASADAMKNPLQLRPEMKLRLLLETDQWLAVADEIRHGGCNAQTPNANSCYAPSYKIRGYGSFQSSSECD